MKKTKEYRVVFKDNNKNDLNSIFDDVFKKGQNIIDNIVDKKEVFRAGSSQSLNNIISFCGDRGTGKSTAMFEFTKTLNTDKFKFEILPTIDPTMFSQNDSIIEIVIARLFEAFDITNIEDSNKQRKVLEKFENIYNQLKTIYEKKYDRFSKEFYEEENLETITRLKNSLEIRQTLNDIIDIFLKLKSSENVQKTHLVISIDDIDMDLKYAYHVVEELRKYLIVPNVIILIACNDIQLNKIINKEFSKTLGDEDNKLSSNYLTKLLPPQNRLYLPSLDKWIMANEVEFIEIDNNGNRIKNDDCSEEVYKKGEAIVDSILGEIYNKTRLVFLKNKYGFNTLIPTNLRELVQLREFLAGLEEPNYEDGFNNKSFEAIYTKKYNKVFKRNVVLFRNYLLHERIIKDISGEELAFIRNLQNLQSGKLNKEIFVYFDKKYVELSKRYEESDINGICIPKIEDDDTKIINYSISKTLHTINTVRDNDKELMDEFIYFVKCVYSTIILEDALTAISENKTSNLLGDLGKNIIGHYNCKNYEYETQFYPILDKANKYILERRVKLVDSNLLDVTNNNEFVSIKELSSIVKGDEKFWLDNLYKILYTDAERKNINLSNYLFLLFISYGVNDGSKLFKPMNIYRAGSALADGHFRLNNLLFHLLDLERNFERSFNHIFEDNNNLKQEIEEQINNKLKTELGLNSNTYLLFPIYSIDYVEKINEFDFHYSSGVDKTNFYRLIYDYFLRKVKNCDKEILKSNTFLKDSNLCITIDKFVDMLKPYSEDLIKNITNFFEKGFEDTNLKEEYAVIISNTNNALKNLSIISENTLNKVCNDDEALKTELNSRITMFTNLINALSDDKYDYNTLIKDLESEILLYSSINYNAFLPNEIKKIISNRKFKNRTSITSRVKAIINNKGKNL